MNRWLGTSVLILALCIPAALLGCANNQRTAGAPVVQETGVLRSGLPAGAGQARAWSIQPGLGQPPIAADVTSVRARARNLDGHSVRAWGRYTERRMRGDTVRTFKVERLEPAR